MLGSLEKLHTSMSGTLGTMRSIRSNGSIPTLERVRREESNHSIGSHSQTSSGQVSHNLGNTAKYSLLKHLTEPVEQQTLIQMATK